MTLLLVKSGGEAAFPEWQAHFATYAPHLAVRWWEDPSVDPDTVDYIVVWEPQPGRIARMRNLKVIFSSAAGVDHIVRDPDLPQHLPIGTHGDDGKCADHGRVCLPGGAVDPA